MITKQELMFRIIDLEMQVLELDERINKLENEKIGISAGDINACINGKRKSAGGFRGERRAYVAQE